MNEWIDDESLYNQVREMNADVLISGMTHELKLSSKKNNFNLILILIFNKEMDNKYFINPGSITGAYSSLSGF